MSNDGSTDESQPTPDEQHESVPDRGDVSDDLKLTTEHDRLDEWSKIRDEYGSGDAEQPARPVFDDDDQRSKKASKTFEPEAEVEDPETSGA